ncbi:PAS domain-containing sensor histidine kinase [Peribacillus kribbensis]|uniref:PAS domain-containing sensor histidine kinase n=1 Tax=Peribacillus kribbensis TaxID=356658 RepID=UPI000426EACB|nr:PAS domain-containing sensor histidine kinase [Peribacillus kribbensis]
MNKQKILIIYLISGIIWVFLTDFFIDSYVSNAQLYSLIQKAKGLFFILLTGLLLYQVLKKSEKFSILQEQEERLSTLINSMVDFVNFKDGEGRWIEANEFGLKLFQIEGAEYKGLKDSELAKHSDFYGDALTYCEISDEETWNEGKITRCEEIIPLPEGGCKTFDTIKVPLFNSDGSRKGLVVIGRDITERVKAEKNLSDSQQMYKSLFDYNPDSVFMMNLEGILTKANPKFQTLMDMGNGALAGTRLDGFVTGIESDKDKLRKAFLYVVNNKTGIATDDITFITSKGSKVLLHCTFVPMLIDGELAGVIGYAKDVTLIRETAERLRKTEKLSIVGELAASVAHEVRNPLTSLKGFVQLLKDNESQYQTYYSIMLSELDRINQIVSELLVLAKPQDKKFKKCNLGILLKEVKALLEPQAMIEGAEILIEEKEELPLILCEANQIKQVFINIIKNSIEAAATTIKISLQRAGEETLIHIKDNGCGIEQERIPHLGEPFYSSKEKGTGLGLTVTQRIIQAHHGRLAFQSKVKEGTDVTILLPSIN